MWASLILDFSPWSEIGDAGFEFIDGLLEALDVGLGVAIKIVEQVAEVLRLGEVEPRFDFFAVLDEDGGGSVFEDRVGEWVAEGDLLADFDVELVAGVFGFPEFAGQRRAF